MLTSQQLQMQQLVVEQVIVKPGFARTALAVELEMQGLNWCLRLV
jgi:hypothetical protein